MVFYPFRLDHQAETKRIVWDFFDRIRSMSAARTAGNTYIARWSHASMVVGVFARDSAGERKSLPR